jgi:sigma-B regulation protein RsbU (phosphoserine phosphatase)
MPEIYQAENSTKISKPYIIRKNNDIYELDSDGPMLGVIKEIEIESGTINLIPGDKIIVYTDGMSETENSEGEPFEVKALISAFKKNIDLNIKDFVNSIYKNLTEFRGSEKFDDDVCILGIEIL